MSPVKLAAMVACAVLAGCYVDMQAVEDEQAKRYTILCRPVVPTGNGQEIVLLTDRNGEQIGASGLTRPQLSALDQTTVYRFVLRKKLLGFTKTWPCYDWVVVEVYRRKDALYVEEPSNPRVQSDAAGEGGGDVEGTE